ncbi:TetR family transcriptional regulator C-terminal domain-containing protein [Nesterenkonia ebinurensis]|uniref:TetR family transcriptional regulator C-terminal domain-containing protein n=1 Tax=Nesterenkonia ebinurensis TaxID=2608252 RepID=UPI00123E0A04|nr:TetR family transcriptional regulator C-terminal domain-containing protein [Nesterenkonia ebinurensis]
MWAVLPVTPEQAKEDQVWLAFRNESATDPELAELVAEDRAMSLGLARHTITSLRDAGQANPEIDVDAAATELVALFDGLCLAAVLTPSDMPAAKLKDTVTRWLDALATRQ